MPSQDSRPALLEVKNLVRHYPVKRGLLKRTAALVHAIDGVSFVIPEGTTFGLVGESGCGKTTLSRLVLRVEPPPEGTILFQGTDIAGLRGKALHQYRRSVQAVFQDPYSSLSPRMRIRDILAEPLSVHGITSHSAQRERVHELLDMVGLNPRVSEQFPHQLSGGQRQRIAIARSLSLSPRLIVLDEPVSALDVSVRAQVLNLLSDIQERLAVSYLFIAHDLAIVTHMSETVGVMYLGQIVELAPAKRLATNALHPYSRALLSSVLPINPDEAPEPLVVAGEPPSPLRPPQGCRFHTRCPLVMERCLTEQPEWKEIEPGHFTACHLF